ncbi:MAG: fructose-6-phosphate aldolase [Dethiobacter sp.]|nr:MAG: fructose-6-phosphate aldolase [Dethiobacter sp.]
MVQIYLDSANLQEIEEALSWGVISGLTTNPTLMCKEAEPFEFLVKKICALMETNPVSVEVLSTIAEGMVKEARHLANQAPNVVVKIPMGVEGLKAVYRLNQGEEKVSCNVTLVFSVNQALLAARAGAAYVSPFLGRLDDIGWDGVGLVREIIEVFTRQGIDTRIIAASIRHPRHVHEAAAVGAHIATVPFSVLKQMARHPLTDIGVERFLADWDRARRGEEIGR